jgi:hypothetical protein
VLDEPQQALVQKTVLTLQAVIFAVAGGAIVAFLALLMLVPAPPAEAPVAGETESTPWLSIVACCVAVSTAVTAPVLRQAMQRTQRMALANSAPTDDAGLASTLLAALTTRYVVSAALFEGAMLLGAVAYFMDRRTWVLWPAAAMLALLLRLVPRRAAVEQTLEGDLAELRRGN